MKRKRNHEDFRAEVDAHLQIEADRLREAGLSPRAADAAARRAFGNTALTLERHYEASRWLWWDHLKQDVRYGFRSMARAPLLTATILGTLALGATAGTAASAPAQPAARWRVPISRDRVCAPLFSRPRTCADPCSPAATCAAPI